MKKCLRLWNFEVIFWVVCQKCIIPSLIPKRNKKIWIKDDKFARVIDWHFTKSCTYDLKIFLREIFLWFRMKRNPRDYFNWWYFCIEIHLYSYLSNITLGSSLLFSHHVRSGGGKPPMDSHFSEIEELSRADNLLFTRRPFSRNILGFCGGTTTFRSIRWNVVCSRK